MTADEEKRHQGALFAIHPKKCSESLYTFLKEHDETIQQFFFVVQLASQFDRASMIAKRALDKVKEKKVDEAEYAKRPMFKQVRLFSRQISRNLLISTSDNFLVYISAIIQEVAKKKYEILRSSEKITISEALQFSKMKDLIAFIADRKINDLSYGGLRDMEVFIRDRLGVELFENASERETLGVFIELRNIHTHNRGIVNELFMNRIAQTRRKDFHLGKYSGVDLDDLEQLAGTALSIALRLDIRLSSKFRLKQVKFSERLDADKKEWIEAIDAQTSPLVELPDE